jgi:hypothetical protein
MLEAAYAHHHEVVWYQCQRCRRMWADAPPPHDRSTNSNSSPSSD